MSIANHINSKLFTKPLVSAVEATVHFAAEGTNLARNSYTTRALKFLGNDQYNKTATQKNIKECVGSACVALGVIFDVTQVVLGSVGGLAIGVTLWPTNLLVAKVEPHVRGINLFKHLKDK